jgi:hypothetical protein
VKKFVTENGTVRYAKVRYGTGDKFGSPTVSYMPLLSFVLDENFAIIINLELELRTNFFIEINILFYT